MFFKPKCLTYISIDIINKLINNSLNIINHNVKESNQFYRIQSCYYTTGNVNIFNKFSNHSNSKKIQCKSNQSNVTNFESENSSLSKIEYIQGQIRVLSRSLAYIYHPLDGKRILVYGSNRNKALNGDIVAVRLLPFSSWRVSGSDRIELPDQTKSTDDFEDLKSELIHQSSEVESVTADPALDSVDVGDIDEPSVSSNQSTISSEEDLNKLPGSVNMDQPFSLLTVQQFVDHHLNYEEILPLRTACELHDSQLPPDLFGSLPHPNLIRTGSVIKILKTNPISRKLLGQIAFYPQDCFGSDSFRFQKPLESLSINENAVCVFLPKSARHNIIKLDPASIPREIWNDLKLGLSNLYVCQIIGWHPKTKLPFGKICEELTKPDDIEAATQKILVEYGIQENNFQPEHLVDLPANPGDFTIPTIEYQRRKDFRSCCVLTIDPASAKDFDDALHIRKLNSGLYEVGIHIADVSYFVAPGSVLDQEAAERTTSVYLVQRVIPMLPSILSEHLCSLVPNQDRLTFSILLTVNESGDVINEWFGRSVIRSRARLTYDQAWNILKLTDTNLTSESNEHLSDLIPAPERPFNYKHLQDSLMYLNRIAENLRKSRIKNGALTLEKVEIQFDLPISNDENSQQNEKRNTNVWPRGFSAKIRNPAHYLIEEWMILANQAVARQLFNAFHKYHSHHNSESTDSLINSSKNKFSDQWLGALLRHHPDPDQKKMSSLVQVAKSGNIDIDVSSSGAISSSIDKLNQRLIELGFDEAAQVSLATALSYLTYVRLSTALYFSLDDSLLLLYKKFKSYIFLENIPLDMSALRELIANPTHLNRQPDSMFHYTWHYGLSIALYTHFTSPIRRYADLIVHRQLASILGCDHWSYKKEFKSSKLLNSKYKDKSETIRDKSLYLKNAHLSPSQLALQAAWCNERRLQTRRAGESSQRLFLTACLRDCGPVVENGVVINISHNKIKVLVVSFGLVIETQLHQFFKNAMKWEFELSPTVGNSKQESKDFFINRPILVTWESDGHLSTDSNPQRNTTRINALSIVPCFIFCPNDKLALHVRFNKNPKEDSPLSVATQISSSLNDDLKTND